MQTMPQREATHTWYVTFEVPKRGPLKQRRHPRLTRTFETELEAKRFAREKLGEGLIVFAGTINPNRPQRVVTSGAVQRWAEGADEQARGSGELHEKDRT